MNKFVKLIFSLVLAVICGACKEYEKITVDVSNREIVFLLPQLPRLDTLYVEQLNTEKDAYQMVWSISFVSSVAEPHTVERIVYGKVPIGAKVDVMSEPRPLKAGVLYTVGMDVGPIVAKGIFMVEKSGTEMKVRNLTYEEANDFRTANRHKAK